jgi:hypothetical protein
MSIATDREFLVDQFLLEVGEGRMPAEGSPEAEAYQEWRMAERRWQEETAHWSVQEREEFEEWMRAGCPEL